MKKSTILNIAIDNISLSELIINLKQGGIVFTPNVDHIMKLQKDTEFAKIYKMADYCVCDSQILLWISRFLSQPIQEKISGSDLFPAFCEYYQKDEEIKIFLLGAPEGIAVQAQQKINTRVGREIIVASYSPSFGFEKNEQECQKILDLIEQSGATVLAVGVGAPKQEKWIVKYKDKLENVKTFLAIGATIEFEAGSRKRSPKWVSQLGLEWLYRLVSEPKRLWKRYLVESLPFFGLVVKQKIEQDWSRKLSYQQKKSD